ncbi:MAG TPA: elongation factor G, partial [Flavisolibacter sp.]|nr:elongation factor G [Flavisolibacter sp.]
DLITNKGVIWHIETEGMTFDEVPVPDDMKEDVEFWRQNLIESIAEYDDKLMEKFFEDSSTITEDEIHEAVRKATIDLSIVPMMCGSSFKNKGVQTALDAVCRYLPSPLDIEAVVGINPNTLLEEKRRPDAKEPFAALAFKIMTDPFVGRLAFFRVYSGHLDAGSYVLNVRSGKKERISRIMKMFANKQNPIDFIEAGDIGAAVGFKEIKTGDTLCHEDFPLTLENMFIPEPVIAVAVEPKTQADVDKMGMAIAKLVEEDPTLRVNTDEETGQTILRGMGELHLEIIVDRMRREFKVEVNQGAPMVAYKEAFNQTVQHREVLKKQTGGRGKFADIQFELGPVDAEWKEANPDKHYQFVNDLFGGSIPREFIPSIQKGFENSMGTGVLASYPVDNLKIRVFDGSFHAVDSDAMSFEICAKQGFREAARKAKPVLLEPIMRIEVITPSQYMGDVTGDLNRRRGMMEGMDTRAGAEVIKAKVPLSEMFGYVTQLRSLSSGRASSTMEFSHYAPAPNNIAEEVIAKSKGKVSAE